VGRPLEYLPFPLAPSYRLTVQACVSETVSELPFP
jgi:hypothetical protein